MKSKFLALSKKMAEDLETWDSPEEVTDFLEDTIDSFRKYFNAVYHNVVHSEMIYIQKSMGRLTPEELQERIMMLDKEQRMAHDVAIDACSIINRQCDRYGLLHICPDVERNEISDKVMNRSQIADFVGKFVYNVYQRGINSPEIEDLAKEGTVLDAVFTVAKQKNIDPDRGYEKKKGVSLWEQEL